jgi:hypothetical protein
MLSSPLDKAENELITPGYSEIQKNFRIPGKFSNKMKCYSFKFNILTTEYNKKLRIAIIF